MTTEEFKLKLKKRIGKAKLTFTDEIIGAIVLPIVPRGLKPNTVTYFRFFCIPFIVYFFIKDYFVWGTIVFILAALSDALDGAMARVRHQITARGKFYDPLADKLLISSVAIILITRYLNPLLTILIIFLELIIISAAWHKKVMRPETNIQARLPGKIKMVLQCVGIIFLLFFILFQIPVFLTLANITLWAAILFALVSVFSYNSI